jgi:hypothetical protein
MGIRNARLAVSLATRCARHFVQRYRLRYAHRVHCHLNYVVADTRQWEQSAAFLIDSDPATDAFVKNAGLGGPSRTEFLTGISPPV